MIARNSVISCLNSEFLRCDLLLGLVMRFRPVGCTMDLQESFPLFMPRVNVKFMIDSFLLCACKT